MVAASAALALAASMSMSAAPMAGRGAVGTSSSFAAGGRVACPAVRYGRVSLVSWRWGIHDVCLYGRIGSILLREL